MVNGGDVTLALNPLLFSVHGAGRIDRQDEFEINLHVLSASGTNPDHERRHSRSSRERAHCQSPMRAAPHHLAKVAQGRQA
jgi:hypothetical protein